MKNLRPALIAFALTCTAAYAQTPSGPVPVTVDNFVRAETDMYLRMFEGYGAFGKFLHRRELPLEGTGVRPNRDTLYSEAVFDLVPVDAFWSVIVYDATGHLKKNDLNAYSLNSITAQKAADGSVAVQFGGCDGKIPNCLPTMPGWNYMVRLYRPRAEILSGKWKFPEAQPTNE